VDLRIPIMISDELSEEVIEATGLLDLASGDIHRVQYQDHDASVAGRCPGSQADYDFSSGVHHQQRGKRRRVQASTSTAPPGSIR
jgi:hypothetical protein